MPTLLKEAGYGGGFTTWEVVRHIMIPYTRVGIRFAGERGVRDEGLSLSALDTFPKPGNWAMLVAGLLGMCAVARPRIFFS